LRSLAYLLRKTSKSHIKEKDTISIKSKIVKLRKKLRIAVKITPTAK
jgi:hypothetical protein